MEKARLFDSPMATTTRYHLLPEDNRPSENESVADNERLLGPFHNDPSPPKERFHISGHATIYTRLAVICLLIPAFVILIIPRAPQTLPAEILSMICVVRNALVLLYHFVSRFFRIRIEFTGRSPSLPIRQDHPHWFTSRGVQITIDILIWIPLFISVTVIGSKLSQCGAVTVGVAHGICARVEHFCRQRSYLGLRCKKDS